MPAAGRPASVRGTGGTWLAGPGPLGPLGRSCVGAEAGRMTNQLTTDSADAGIRPFRIEVPQPAPAPWGARLTRTRWPEPETAEGWDQGAPLKEVQELAAYWADGYDWRRHEAQLNTFPQFTTTIDGQLVHFVHVRSPEPDAFPL